MSTEMINSFSTCNYASLGNYYGIERKPNTLNNISVRYPVVPGVQLVPMFAGTGDYSKPNYNTLCKGSCYQYAGINQAYIDCSSPESSQGCKLNGGNCVVYKARQCPPENSNMRFANVNGTCMVDPKGPFKTIDECRSQPAKQNSSMQSAVFNPLNPGGGYF